MEIDVVLWAWVRISLAAACVGALMAARWNHERQLAKNPSSSRAMLERRTLEARTVGTAGGRVNFRLPPFTHPLYWLGLTTSAALAAQAIATLLAATL
ncbi:MAG: hypothetical protein ACR2NO_03455 [Chloroflexota bacterium]